MAENKKSFILYADLIHTVKKMPKGKRAELFMTILEYVNDENPVVEDLIVNLVWEPIKFQLKRDLDKYEKFRSKQIENGRKGGRPTKENESQIIPENPSLFSESLYVNDTVTVNGNVNKRTNVLVVEKPTTVKKEEYEKLLSEYKGKDLKEIVIALKEFISRKPLFLEPYTDYWNMAVDKTCIPKIIANTDKRIKKIKTRLSEPEFNFIELIKIIKSTPRLTTENEWFTFDWLIDSQANYIKVLEGNYNA